MLLSILIQLLMGTLGGYATQSKLEEYAGLIFLVSVEIKFLVNLSDRVLECTLLRGQL